MTGLNASLEAVTGNHTIACECADVECVATIELTSEAYEGVRSNPRHFAVLSGHVVPDVERVFGEFDNYVVVEKMNVAGAVAEAAAVDL